MIEEPEKEIIMKLSAMLPQGTPSARPIRCAECGSKNPARRKFCGKCGKQLWDPCLQCGEFHSSQEEFCGNCGVPLRESLQEKIAAFESDIEMAVRLKERKNLQEAIDMLKPIAAVAHSQLASAAERAKSLLLQCYGEQKEWAAKIKKIEEEIPHAIATGTVDSAMERIREVPALLRSPGLLKYLDNLEKQKMEIAEIDRTLAQSGEQSLSAEFMEKVARLLVLQPNHEEALKKAAALKRGAMRQTKSYARNGDFEKAWETINLVPATFQDEEYCNFRDRIGDLAYWAWDLIHAPGVDKSLIEFARRLHKYLPEDSELKKMCKKLTAREAGFESSAVADFRWSEAVPPPIFGAAMEFLRGFGRVRTDRCENAAIFEENPGRFAVACGLALQGLGLAPIETNLLPEETWVGKIGRWLPKRKARSVWGIEISSSGIKAVKLSSEADREKEATESEPVASLCDCRIIEHRRRLMQSTNDKERDSLLEETLQTFLEQNPFRDDPVILGIPDWMVLLKTVELPPMPLAKREAVIEHEARHLFPMPMQEVRWEHTRFDDPEDEESLKQPFSVAYFGVRRMLLDELLSRWQKAGVKIAAVQCDMAALYNFAAIHRSMNKCEGPIAFVDLGASRLNVLVCSPKRIWHRSVMFGSDQINKALVRDLKLTYSQAEQWKRDPSMATSIGKYYETLQPIYEIYVQEISDSLAAYHKAFPGERVGRIVGCGGGLAAHDLPRYFLWRR